MWNAATATNTYQYSQMQRKRSATATTSIISKREPIFLNVYGRGHSPHDDDDHDDDNNDADDNINSKSNLAIVPKEEMKTVNFAGYDQIALPADQMGWQ